MIDNSDYIASEFKATSRALRGCSVGVCEDVKKMFGERAGFAEKEHQTTGGVWRTDMLKCPYFDTCRQYRCAELCDCFCDSDDISYSNLHKNLLWKRTKTLGKGGDCCDFCLMLESKAKDKA